MSTQLPIDYKSGIEALRFNAERSRHHFEDAASRGFPANNQERLQAEMTAAETALAAARDPEVSSGFVVQPEVVETQPFADPVSPTVRRSKRVAVAEGDSHALDA